LQYTRTHTLLEHQQSKPYGYGGLDVPDRGSIPGQGQRRFAKVFMIGPTAQLASISVGIGGCFPSGKATGVSSLTFTSTLCWN